MEIGCGAMKTVDEAWAILDAEVRALPEEAVDLSSAAGRVLRRDVAADSDQPPFARSAMDGYLVRLSESAPELRLAGEILPGECARMPGAGTAIRIFTGSAVPADGAAVVMQEDVDREGEFIRMKEVPGTTYIRQRGSQARRGDVLLAAGGRISPGAVALLASCGVARPIVSPRIRVAHVATGRELVNPSETPVGGQIRDSNSPMIAALVSEAGGEMIWQGGVDEDPVALAAAIESALEKAPHMLLVSGGASVGDHDNTARVFRDAGFELLIRGVAVRPGKPLIIARRHGLLAVCLPGNPLSHFVSFHLFVRRAMGRLLGAAAVALKGFPVEDPSKIEPGDRETWWPCQMAYLKERVWARPLPWADSSDITPLARADGLLRVPPHGLGPTTVASVLMTGP